MRGTTIAEAPGEQEAGVLGEGWRGRGYEKK